MKRSIGSREFVFRATAGILSAAGAVMLALPFLGGPSRSGGSLGAMIGEIVFFVALGTYAVVGEGPAYKVLGITPPPELRGDDKGDAKHLPAGDGQDGLPESRKPDP